jgi:hypothetical protein
VTADDRSDYGHAELSGHREAADVAGGDGQGIVTILPLQALSRQSFSSFFVLP